MAKMKNKWKVVHWNTFSEADTEASIIHIHIESENFQLPFHHQVYSDCFINRSFQFEWEKLLIERAEELCRIMNNEEKRREIKGIP